MKKYIVINQEARDKGCVLTKKDLQICTLTDEELEVLMEHQHPGDTDTIIDVKGLVTIIQQWPHLGRVCQTHGVGEGEVICSECVKLAEQKINSLQQLQAKIDAIADRMVNESYRHVADGIKAEYFAKELRQLSAVRHLGRTS